MKIIGGRYFLFFFYYGGDEEKKEGNQDIKKTLKERKEERVPHTKLAGTKSSIIFFHCVLYGDERQEVRVNRKDEEKRRGNQEKKNKYGKRKEKKSTSHKISWNNLLFRFFFDFVFFIVYGKGEYEGMKKQKRKSRGLLKREKSTSYKISWNKIFHFVFFVVCCLSNHTANLPKRILIQKLAYSFSYC